MTDVLTPEQRQFNMSRIRGRDTKPEKLLRSALHAEGLRFRIHRRDIPGRPDLVFVKARVAVFIDGCFWHGCPVHCVKPKTNRAFWLSKIRRNKARDVKVNATLAAGGWKVRRYWEHDLKIRMPQIVRALTRLSKRSCRKPA